MQWKKHFFCTAEFFFFFFRISSENDDAKNDRYTKKQKTKQKTPIIVYLYSRHNFKEFLKRMVNVTSNFIQSEHADRVGSGDHPITCVTLTSAIHWSTRRSRRLRVMPPFCKITLWKSATLNLEPESSGGKTFSSEQTKMERCLEFKFGFSVSAISVSSLTLMKVERREK